MRELTSRTSLRQTRLHVWGPLCEPHAAVPLVSRGAAIGYAMSKIARLTASRIAKFLPIAAIGLGLVASAIWTTALVWLALDGVWFAAFSLATAL